MKKIAKYLIMLVFGLALIGAGFSFAGINLNNVVVRAIDASAATEAIASGNCVNNGGAIYLADGATYTMNGGTITGHVATNGGAIYVGDGAVFTMTGGTISGNYAKYGGAIYVANGGECYLNAGTIDTCTATTEGNAIYVEDGGYVEMSEDFVISNGGADYSYSIKAVNPVNVKRPVTVTPYVDGVANTEISTYSNETISSIGLPTATGCGWYEEAAYTNEVTTSNLVSTYAETDELNVYFPSHSYGSWVTTKAATCTATGSKKKTCTRCSHVTTSSIAKDSSNHGTWGTYTETITAATCTATGTLGTYCSGCNALKSSSTIAIDADNHSSTGTYTSTIKAATCTATGTMGTYHSCCDALKTTSTIAIDAENHSSTGTYTSTITAATCTTNGTKGTYHSCCDALKSTSSITKLGHSYTSSVTKAATCTATGVRTYTCSRTNCDSSYTEDIAIDSSNHTGTTSTTITKAATCTTSGTQTTAYTCCGAVTKTSTIAALGHRWLTTDLKHSCTRCNTSGSHMFLISADGASVCGTCGYTTTDGSGSVLTFEPRDSGSAGEEITLNDSINVSAQSEVAFIKEEDSDFDIRTWLEEKG